MKICRLAHSRLTAPRYALVEDDYAILLEPEYHPGDAIEPSDQSLQLADCRLLAPVVPSKIVCVGRNYREHAAELGNKMPEEPLLFLKAPSSIIASGEAIRLPPQSQQVEHEGELGLVIGSNAWDLSTDDEPLDYLLGYTCVNDVTARDLQRKDVQFTRGKSFDTFCPVGPWIVTDLDCTNLDVTTRLNGEIKQHGNTRDMAFPAAFLIRYISSVMTLYPGDLIATGTPAGVSRMKDGDFVEVEVSGVGTLKNQVYDRVTDEMTQR
jgi:2-keto-4-pentenoate hydratase/2-oxohepta-3-ene-1,7-dioic acid hydratase in catechol pathway